MLGDFIKMLETQNLEIEAESKLETIELVLQFGDVAESVEISLN